MSHSASSTSSASPASTAPSTPPTECAPAYFLLSHKATAAFLKSLPAQQSSGDRVFLLEGHGKVHPLLEEAVDTLEDKTSIEPGKWAAVKATDDGREVVYYRTTPSHLATPNDDLSLDKLSGNTDRVRFPPLSRSATLTLLQRPIEETLNVLADAHLRLVVSLTSTDDSLVLHILERPAVTFPRLSLTPSSPLNPTGSPYNMPSLSEFQDGWRVWDLITLGMIPPSLLHSKPIDLRHKPLFYLGHLPTFLNLLMTKYLGERPVEPVRFTTIFERGIDPHVDDPEHCHSHSEVPEKDEDWPALGEVLAYRDRVRERLAKLYAELLKGERQLTRRLARTLVMVLEHDGFHIEVRAPSCRQICHG